MAQTDSTAPALIQVGSRDKRAAWYSANLQEKLGKPARELFETYSKIPANEVEQHILAIREEAWQVWPYPCIGGFRFLDLAISQSPHYPEILSRLKTGKETFLDLGCCVGQELRKVAADGAPSENLYGSDLRPEFFDLGYKLFRDKETLKSQFIAADIFDPSSPLDVLDGKVDIIYIGSFLHLFSYEQQFNVCVKIVKFLKDKKDSLVVGRQVGALQAGEQVRMDQGQERKRYRHNEESFKKMWEDVGKKTGSQWKVEIESTEFNEGRDPASEDLPRQRLRFAVFREAN